MHERIYYTCCSTGTNGSDIYTEQKRNKKLIIYVLSLTQRVMLYMQSHFHYALHRIHSRNSKQVPLHITHSLKRGLETIS